MAYIVRKKPWISALLVLILGPFGFLYYSFRKALVVFLLFFLLPSIILYQTPNSTAIEIFRWIILIALATYAYLDVEGRLDIIEKFSTSLIGFISIPIIFANFFGEIVGAIWLLFLGQWQLVILGFILTFLIPYIYTLSLLIQIPLASLLAYTQKHNKKTLSLILAFITMFIGHAIIIFYVMFVADKAIVISELNGLSLIALLLFGYGVATGPFSYMARGEDKDAIGSFIGVFISQISYIILAVGYLFNLLPLAFTIVLFIVFGSEMYLLSVTSRIIDYEKK